MYMILVLSTVCSSFVFLTDSATTESHPYVHTLSLHDALPICLRHVGQALHAMSPLATLERGYAILFDANGQVLRSVQGVLADTPLRARLADGELPLRVGKD